MASFEVVVRPVVFPNIRPAPAQPITPAADPEQGFATIRGNGAKHIDLSQSWSASTSSNKHQETQRRVDKARVYQQNDDGTVNRDNFIDIEVANKIWFKGPPDPMSGALDQHGEVPDTLSRMADKMEERFYQPIEEAKNIEIKKRNQIKTNPMVSG